MRELWATLLGVGLMTLLVPSLAAQSAWLGETTTAGDCFRYELELQLQGKLKVEQQGKLASLPLAAAAKHQFVERTEGPDARGAVGKTLRHYAAASSQSTTAGELAKRSLRAERALIAVQRSQAGTLHYCPDGPLTREELELVAEHFDTLCLPGLLPNREVKVGDTWNVGPEATQQACLLSGVIQADFTGTVEEITAEQIRFRLTGSVEGIETGAPVKLTIQAEGRFSIAMKRIVSLKWQQTDDREQGPAGPAAEMNATISLARTLLPQEPNELGEIARAKLPTNDEALLAMTQLSYTDVDERYSFTTMRDWHIVGRTPDHLILRLLDDGDFTAQATITVLKPSAVGKRTTLDEFKKLLAAIPNWQPEALLEEGLLPTGEPSLQLTKVVMQGKQDNTSVRQHFYLLSQQDGQQIAITVLTTPEKAAKIAGRDLAWIQTIRLKTAK